MPIWLLKICVDAYNEQSVFANFKMVLSQDMCKLSLTNISHRSLPFLSSHEFREICKRVMGYERERERERER